jgi:hypothetical protein
MLLGFQHSTDAFHLVIPKLTPLLHYLATALHEARKRDKEKEQEKEKENENEKDKEQEHGGTGEQKEKEKERIEYNEDDPKRPVEHAVVMQLATAPPIPPFLSSRSPSPSTPLQTTNSSTETSQTTTSSPETSTTSSETSPSATLSTTPTPSTSTSVSIPPVYLNVTTARKKSEEVMTQLGRLIRVLMVHHMGHPELYEPLVADLDLVNVLPPDDSETKAVSSFFLFLLFLFVYIFLFVSPFMFRFCFSIYV